MRVDRQSVSGVDREDRLGFDAAPFRLEAATELVDRALGVAELVVRPRSELIDQIMFPGVVTPSGDLVVRESGSPSGCPARLAAGSALLEQLRPVAVGIGRSRC